MVTGFSKPQAGYGLPAALLAVLLLAGALLAACGNPLDENSAGHSPPDQETPGDEPGTETPEEPPGDEPGAGTPEETPGDEPGAGTPEEPPGGEPGAGTPEETPGNEPGAGTPEEPPGDEPGAGTPEEPPGDEPGNGTPEEPPGDEPGNGSGQSALEALSAWFAARPANTPETPYFYSLADASFEDLASGADGLGALLAALHGRYAEIDLSGLSGGTLAAGPSANNVRLNADCLVAVTLPASLTAIGRRAFASCRNLKTVALKGTTPPALTGNDVFRDCSPDIVFLVDDDRGTLAWPRASGWRNYGGRIRIRFEAGGVVFSMTCVPATDAFPKGLGDNQTGSVASPYLIAETEVTWELWNAVRDWAQAEGGYAIRPGTTSPGGNNQTPARNNWYNFAAWCNALTEWYNAKTGAALTPAYYADYTNGFSAPVRSGDPGFGQQETEMPYRALEGKTGFRLPNRNEWELAARWRNDDTNTVAGYSNPWFTRGNSASGAAAPYTDATETLRYATGTLSAPLPVKSRLPNALGLYDMSGNVWELLNDGWYYAAYNVQNCNIQVIEMGGGWNMALKTAQLAYDYYYEADGTSDWDGLRLVLPLP